MTKSTAKEYNLLAFMDACVAQVMTYIQKPSAEAVQTK